MPQENLDGFAAHLQAKGKQPATIESYCRDAQRFLEFLDTCNLSPTKVEPDTLVQFQEQLRRDERDNSVRRSIIGVRMFYRYLVTAKLIIDSPFDEVPIPQRNDQLPQKLFNAEIERVISTHLANPKSVVELRNALIIALLAYEGLKATELIALQWRHYLHSEPASMRIPGTKARTIQLDNATGGLVCRYRDTYLQMQHHPAMRRDPERRIIIAFRGRDASTPIPKMTRHGLKFIIYELGKQTGIDHLNTELLRHYAVSHLLTQGRTPESIMQHLGLRRLGNIAKHIAKIQSVSSDV